MEFLSYRIELFDISLGVAIAELAVTLVAGIVVWYAIRWRERLRAARGLASHSGLRLVLAAGAMLTMLFSGGCTLLFAAVVLRDFMALSSSDAEGGRFMMGLAGTILIVGGIPFVLAVLAWFVLMARKSS